MQIEMLYWTSDLGWTSLRPAMPSQPAHLVLYFGQAKQEGVLGSLLQRFPQTPVVGCTSAGEILDWEVLDNSIAACAIWFQKAWIQSEWIEITSASSSHQAGRKLAQKLAKEQLKGVLILSEGLNINGSELVKGLRSELGEGIPIVGGLAGDGSQFEQTRVGCSFLPRPNIIAAVGFFGPVVIGHGSVGGWDAFGPKRIITKSEANILYELDGKPALDLYKVYLAEDADKLPASALLFPLNVYAGNAEDGVVRTVLQVDENTRSMTFAGDVPQGFTAQLMRANFDHIIDGAGQAARIAAQKSAHPEGLAILISCVGRKMILGQRTADEVEAVQEILGPGYASIGFYSYGEISPHVHAKQCSLHNQTMTITLISEAV